MLSLVNTINDMIDQLAIFADEVKKVAREVGTEGKLGVQAEVGNVQWSKESGRRSHTFSFPF
jgi:osomolarity two-component system sensor histidine kinase NIK1